MRKVDKNQEVMEKRLVYKKKGEKEEEKENLARSHTVPAEEEYNPGMLNAPPPPFCVCVCFPPPATTHPHTRSAAFLFPSRTANCLTVGSIVRDGSSLYICACIE